MALHLEDHDKAMASGAMGEAAAMAMRLLARFSEALGAERLMDCVGAHIDGCLYHGEVSLDFVERLVAAGGRVKVPTTLNVGSMDLIHPELFNGPRSLASAGTRLMQAHEELGCLSTFTCAPYQTIFRPRFGDQIAWAESNAIVFANSVLGARTNRYGDFIDLACAITGRIPDHGLHRTENRRATVIVDILEIPEEWSESRDALCVAVGHAVGELCGDEIAAITGLPSTLNEDDLKALGAVAASAGSVALFHAVGLTPEAPTLEAATQGGEARLLARLSAEDLRARLASLTTADWGSPLTAVALGTPHFSYDEFQRLLPLLRARPPTIDVYVNTGRGVLEQLSARGEEDELQRLGVTLVVDTCSYVTSVMRQMSGVMMTNSGKWAHYAPGNLGVDVVFGSMADCVASAHAGRAVRA